MCKKRSEEDILIEQGSEEEEPFDVDTATEEFALGAGSITGIIVLVLLLLCAVITGAYVIVKYSDTDAAGPLASSSKQA